jgi:glucose/arabinose dehydrogenase
MIDRRVRGVYRRASVVRPTAVSSFVVPSFVVALILVGAAPVCVAQSSQNAATPKVQSDGCAADNGGITLSPGFCATVFADNLGHARQMVFGPDGTLYVNTWSGTYYHNDKVRPGGFLIALKDSKGDGHADRVERFGPTQAQGSAGGTGIRIYNNGLYAEQNDKIIRYPLPTSGIVPTENPQVIVSGLPLTGDHPMHPFAIDEEGHLFIDLGSATNSCQYQNRMPNSPGHQPCTELETRAGIWLYDANKKDQHFSPAERYATGLRNGEGFAFDSAGRLFVTQHGRDQLSQNWPRYFSAQQNAQLPAEEIVLMRKGADYGWPECYYDQLQSKLVLAPDYGGDGKEVGMCANKQTPVAAFPGHWAPNDLLIYAGRAFPAGYQGGAFVAFHGSWNRAPEPQDGYNVVFQPLADGKSAGPFVVFADGFAGAVKEPGQAAFRPSGLANGPGRGSLYFRGCARTHLARHLSWCRRCGPRTGAESRRCRIGRARPAGGHASRCRSYRLGFAAGARRRYHRAGRLGRSHLSRRSRRRHLRRLSRHRCERFAAGTIPGQRQVAGHGRHLRRPSPYHHRRRAAPEVFRTADAAARRCAAE